MLVNAFPRSSANDEEVAWYRAAFDHILDLTRGTPDEPTAIWGAALVLQAVDSHVAVPRLTELLDRARELDDAELSERVERIYADALQRAGRLGGALALLDAGLAAAPPGDRLTWHDADRLARRLEVVVELRTDRAVLDESLALLERVRALPTTGPEVEDVNWSNVVERLLDTCRHAAKDQEEWQLTLDLNAERVRLKRRRGAPDLEVARALGNDAGSLLRLRRFDEAEAVLLACKEVAEREGAHADVGIDLSTLAGLEVSRGRRSAGRRLEVEALRHKYLSPRPAELAVSHFNLGSLLQFDGVVAEGFAHIAAAVAICLWIGSGRTDHYVGTAVRLLGGFPPDEDPLPASYADLCAGVQATPGVRFEELAADLAGDEAAGVLALLRERLAEPVAEAREKAQGLVDHFEPVVDLAAHATSDPLAAEVLDIAVVALEYDEGFRDLGGALRRMLASGADDTVTVGLGGGSRLVAHAIRARRRSGPRNPSIGETIRAADSALEGSIGRFHGILRTFDALVAAAAASAQGVDGAEAALERELANVEGGDWARLVPRVRSILRGERGEALHVGLDALDRAVLRRVLAAVGPA